MSSKKVRHHNMQDHFSTKTEVYEKFQSDYDSHTYQAGVWQLVIIGSALGLVFVSEQPHLAWLVLAIYASMRGLFKQFDASNANYMLHLIDWIEHNADSGAE